MKLLPMLRITIISVGVILILAGCLLSLFGFVGRGINDGEWRNISQTGLPSVPEQFQWAPWQPNDGSVYPFSSFQPEHRPDTLPEFRVGRARGILFDFVCYQGRFTRDGISREFPAIGPGWGARYHWRWPCLAYAFGVCFLVAGLLMRR